jgi:CHASE2 domain-containing sensor protein
MTQDSSEPRRSSVVDSSGHVKRRRRFWSSETQGACLCVCAGLLFLIFPIGHGLAELSYDLLFYFRPDIGVEEAVVVYMDEASHRNLQQPYDGSWDWAKHAELLERLTTYRAKAVVFDLLFSSPPTNTPAQMAATERLIQAARRHGKVACAAMVSLTTLEDGTIISPLSTPFAGLKTNAAWGVVERSLDAAHTVREHYLGASDRPSLAWAVAELTMTNPPPAIPRTRRWINYYGPPRSLKHYSFYQVLDLSNDLSAAFSNKVVFVGADPDIGYTAGRGDYFRTPYSRWNDTLAPGVEINATTYLNLWRGDWLTQASPLSELLIVLLTGTIFGYGLSRVRPLTAVGLAMGSLVLLLAGMVILSWKWHWWFSWLIVGAVQVPCALGWSIWAEVRRWVSERAFLEGAVSATRLMASPGPPQPAVSPRPSSSLDGMGGWSGSSRFESGSGQAGSPAGPQDQAPKIPDHTLLRRIGKGAYGEVWLASDIIGTFHAAKVVYRNSFDSEEPFEREFNGIRKFTPISRLHTSLVHILHVGKNDPGGYIYYVMELGDDEKTGQKIDPATYSPKTLAKELKARKRLPVDECVSVAIHLASALDFLQQQKLIHRDIKPSNIIFVRGVPKFADIGLVTEAAARGGDVTYLGTKGYIPPEGPGTPAGDVYSLGKVIYEAGVGLDCSRFPELPMSLVAEPGDAKLFQLNRIIMKACEPEAGRRYQSAAELHADLEKLREPVRK